MSNWNQFEENCLDYLIRKYGNSNIQFISKGKSDSTIPDILVEITNKDCFYIECKMSNAQSGQFVICPNNDIKKYEFSKDNKSRENEFTDMFIEHMNNNFERYCNVGTSAIPIMINSTLSAKWIIDYYISKNVKFIITEFNKQFVILPIKKFNEYFEIEANYRRKKSGSSDVPKSSQNDIIGYLRSEYPGLKYSINGSKLCVYSTEITNKAKFTFGKNNYQLTYNSDINMFVVRKLGKTNNPNVIFSINCIRSQVQSDLDEFLNKFKI